MVAWHCRTTGGLLLVACLASASARAAPDFGREVLPVLAASCLACHGFDAESREAGLRLDLAEAAVAPLASGRRAIVPGDVEASELVRRIASDDPAIVMPPPESGRTLTSEQRDLLKEWIAAGGDYRPHWAFVAPRRQEPPNVPGVDHPIDRFLAAGRAASGLAAAPQAPPEMLLRRLSLDLTGLPPTIEESDAFLAAWQADPEAAWSAAVERLLASPHYGERQARWWLDMARYADSNGYSIDAPRDIWPWRDWVVAAFNRDLPFDRFTIEQLAGDLLPDATLDQRIATGFHRNTPLNEEGGIDKEQFRVDSVFDRVATTGTVWLGLTIGCAQCHDHKFDPLSQRDFYGLFAFFNSQAEPKLRVPATGVDPAVLQADRDAARAAVQAFIDARPEAIGAWSDGLDDAIRGALSAEAKAALETAAEARTSEQRRILFAVGPGIADQEFRAVNERYLMLQGQLTTGPTTLVLEELPQPRRTTLFVKGDFTRPADEVTPATPAVLPGVPLADRATRLDLARWIVDPANPLTARVLVNRVWQRLFGRGIVETDDDFGLMGTPPTHPELLDWLAVEVPRQGWSVKSLHRLIVTSRAYRQDSRGTPESLAVDPHNLFFARQRRLRLDAEAIRDVALVASGRLSATIGGPPVFPPIPAGATAVGQVAREWKASTGPDRYRRGLYTFLFRASPPPALVVFDAPDGTSACTRRGRSNTPLQALTLLNDQGFVELAEALGEIVARDGAAIAFRRATGRVPDADDLAALDGLGPVDVARVLLNLDETVTRE